MRVGTVGGLADRPSTALVRFNGSRGHLPTHQMRGPARRSGDVSGSPDLQDWVHDARGVYEIVLEIMPIIRSCADFFGQRSRKIEGFDGAGILT